MWLTHLTETVLIRFCLIERGKVSARWVCPIQQHQQDQSQSTCSEQISPNFPWFRHCIRRATCVGARARLKSVLGVCVCVCWRVCVRVWMSVQRC